MNPLLVWWALDDATLTRGVSTEACAPPVSGDRRPGCHRGTLSPKQARAYGASRRSLLVPSRRAPDRHSGRSHLRKCERRDATRRRLLARSMDAGRTSSLLLARSRSVGATRETPALPAAHNSDTASTVLPQAFRCRSQMRRTWVVQRFRSVEQSTELGASRAPAFVRPGRLPPRSRDARS